MKIIRVDASIPRSPRLTLRAACDKRGIELVSVQLESQAEDPSTQE